MADNKVKIIVTADTTNAKKNLEEIGSKLTDIGTRISGAFTLPVVGALAAAVTQSKQLQDAIAPIKTAFQTVAEGLGNVLVPILKEMTPTILRIVYSFNELLVKFHELPIEQKNLIVGFVGFIAAVGPVIMIIGQIVQFVGILQVLIPNLTISMTGLGVAVGSVAASFFLLYSAFKLFEAAFNSKEWKQFKALFMGGLTQLAYSNQGDEMARKMGLEAFMKSSQESGLLDPAGSPNSPKSINVFINSLLNTADQDQVRRTMQPIINDALRQAGYR